MIIQSHKFSNELISITDELKQFVKCKTSGAGRNDAWDFVDKNVKVVFNDVSSPCVSSTMNNVYRVIADVMEKHENPKSEEEARLYQDLGRLRSFLGDNGNGENLCGECLYYPWFTPQSDYRDEDVRKDMDRVRRELLSAHLGYKIAGEYSKRAKTITLYTKNIGGTEIDYISVFAHEVFHAVHEYLIDSTDESSRYDENGEYDYYGTHDTYCREVICESLATHFQIEFLNTLGRIGMQKANEVLSDINRYSVIYFPYSGARYFYERKVDFINVLNKSLNSFKNALEELVRHDRYTVEIILNKRPTTRSGRSPFGMRRFISREYPVGMYEPYDIIFGVPVYLLPGNENVFNGMIEMGNRVGIIINYDDGRSEILDTRIWRYGRDASDIVRYFLIHKFRPDFLEGAVSILLYVIW